MDRYYISVRFENNNKSYYFSCDTNALSVDDYVIVETTIGKEIGRVAVGPKPMSGLNFDKEIKPILRILNMFLFTFSTSKSFFNNKFNSNYIWANNFL